MSLFTARTKLSSLNGHLICGLCGGYLIDATVLTECVHVFCRSCILKYLAEHKVCPLCQSLIQETRPGQALQPDVALQRIVYKLVPGLLRTEMKRLADFCASVSEESEQVTGNMAVSELIKDQPGDTSSSGFCYPPLPTALGTRSLSKSPSALPSSQITWKSSAHNRLPSSVAFLVGEQEFLSITLTHLRNIPEQQSHELNSSEDYGHSSVPLDIFKDSKKNHRFSPFPAIAQNVSDTELSESIHLLCPSMVTIETLHHLLLAKYQLDPGRQIVDLYLNGECLEPSHSLREIAFLYAFPARRQRMCLGFIFGDACVAWWGRPMPRLERPSQKDHSDLHQNGWSASQSHRSSTSPYSLDNQSTRQRARSISGESCRVEVRQKPKRTSL